MKTLSIRQPWAWLIAAGHKTIENRTWATNYRGPVLIHASKTHADGEDDYIAREMCRELGIDLPAHFEYGAVIGIAEITDCVTDSVDDWFEGPVGFVLKQARPVTPFPVSGKLHFFEVDYTPE